MAPNIHMVRSRLAEMLGNLCQLMQQQEEVTRAMTEQMAFSKQLVVSHYKQVTTLILELDRMDQQLPQTDNTPTSLAGSQACAVDVAGTSQLPRISFQQNDPSTAAVVVPVVPTDLYRVVHPPGAIIASSTPEHQTPLVDSRMVPSNNMIMSDVGRGRLSSVSDHTHNHSRNPNNNRNNNSKNDDNTNNNSAASNNINANGTGPYLRFIWTPIYNDTTTAIPIPQATTTTAGETSGAQIRNNTSTSSTMTATMATATNAGSSYHIDSASMRPMIKRRLSSRVFAKSSARTQPLQITSFRQPLQIKFRRTFLGVDNTTRPRTPTVMCATQQQRNEEQQQQPQQQQQQPQQQQLPQQQQQQPQQQQQQPQQKQQQPQQQQPQQQTQQQPQQQTQQQQQLQQQQQPQQQQQQPQQKQQREKSSTTNHFTSSVSNFSNSGFVTLQSSGLSLRQPCSSSSTPFIPTVYPPVLARQCEPRNSKKPAILKQHTTSDQQNQKSETNGSVSDDILQPLSKATLEKLPVCETFGKEQRTVAVHKDAGQPDQAKRIRLSSESPSQFRKPDTPEGYRGEQTTQELLAENGEKESPMPVLEPNQLLEPKLEPFEAIDHDPGLDINSDQCDSTSTGLKQEPTDVCETECEFQLHTLMFQTEQPIVRIERRCDDEN